MSKRQDEEQISKNNTKRLKNERSVDEAKTEIVTQVTEQVKEILEDPIEEGDATDRLMDTIKEIFQPILDEFKDLIGENEDKKSFIGGLIRIFTILLSSKTSSLAKIKKVVRISTEIPLNLWPEKSNSKEAKAGNICCCTRSKNWK